LKKVIVHKMSVFVLSTAFVSKISHFNKNWSRYNHKCILVFMWNTGCCCRNV